MCPWTDIWIGGVAVHRVQSGRMIVIYAKIHIILSAGQTLLLILASSNAGLAGVKCLQRGTNTECIHGLGLSEFLLCFVSAGHFDVDGL